MLFGEMTLSGPDVKRALGTPGTGATGVAAAATAGVVVCVVAVNSGATGIRAG